MIRMSWWEVFNMLGYVTLFGYIPARILMWWGDRRHWFE